jgi:hypothetical protein
MQFIIKQYDLDAYNYIEYDASGNEILSYDVVIDGGSRSENNFYIKHNILMVNNHDDVNNQDSSCWNVFGAFIYKNNDEYSINNIFPLEFQYYEMKYTNIGHIILDKLQDLYSTIEKKEKNNMFSEKYSKMFNKNIRRVLIG